MENETRAPQTEEQWQDELKTLMDADTTIDALRKLRELKARRVVVWIEPDNTIAVARLSVAGVNELIRVLENLTIG